jgi:hypothetical protein
MPIASRLACPERYGVMTLDTDEFIGRFLMHVLPQGFTATVTTAC